jgi:hypothetical protein
MVDSVTLRAGDLDNSGGIDVVDLATMAQNMGLNETPW